MKYSKPLTAAAVVTGLVVGGAGIAAAGEGADREIEETEVAALQVQLEDDQADGDDEGDDADGERNGRNGRRGQRLTSVAEVLGIEADELRSELQDGATVADVAEANGVDVDDVVDALIANIEERLDAKVEDGDITAQEAAEKLESKTERISNKVNGIDNNDDDEQQANFGRGERGNRGGAQDVDAEGVEA